MRRIGAAGTALAIALMTAAGIASAGAPRYSGPAVSSPADAPFTALVITIDGYCTGAILDERRVLTAAHCVTGAQGQVLAPGQILVAAGTHQLVDEQLPPGFQASEVAAIRRHPAYDGSASGHADVAVLELAEPWSFSPTVAPIALVPTSSTSAIPAGTAVRGFGWGESAPGVDDGREHLLDLTTRDRLDCPGAAGTACVSSPAGGGCFGDSGGPLLDPATGQLVGSVAAGAGSASCMPNGVMTIVDLSAPGIGLFIRGENAPPALPRTAAAPALTAPPVTGGAATCTPPAWTDAASTTTVFAHQDGGRVVQEGPSTTYVPQPTDAGHVLTCRSIAHSPGGDAVMPAAGTVDVLAPTLSVEGRGRRLVVTYAGAPRLGLRATATRGDDEAWARDLRTKRTARVPKLAPGRYRLCVTAPAAGQFSSAEACTPLRVRAAKPAKPRQPKKG